jgi:protocatechuate 3,4-dioxygenase alpha subunit
MNETTPSAATPLLITPSQTGGPFLSCALVPPEGPLRPVFSNEIAGNDVAGERIRIEGRVHDGDGAPVTDATVEIWQADSRGQFASGRDRSNASFPGFGRTQTDREGRYGFLTVKPGPVPGPGGSRQAPHVNVGIFARGIMRRLFTRVYFSDEIHNANDPILALVPGDRCLTLIAHRTERDSRPVYTFDIILQGEKETVFFEA